jgi:N6-adenosine-specific RNA methylase IME4
MTNSDVVLPSAAEVESRILLREARRALAEADTLPEIAALTDRAEVARVAARKAKLSEEACLDWEEFSLDAQREAGKMLASMNLRGGDRRSEHSKAQDAPLKEVGVTRIQSQRWQAVASLPDEDYEQYKEKARAKGEITRAGAIVEAKRYRAEQRTSDIATAAPPDLATLGPFPVLYADPPWQYEGSVSSVRRVENQYPTMTLPEIKALDVPASDDAVLFLWVTSPKLTEGLEVMASWGFTYRTSMVWVKDRIGMGFYARQRHEFLLIGRRGDLPAPLESRRPDSVVEAPRGEHSTKPDVFYELIERMYPFPGKWCELFQRRPREGWTGWGQQA